MIKTPVCLTDEEKIEDTIMQGESISSILCTTTMGQVEKECTISAIKYRSKVDIPKLGFVDDVLDMNECGW